MRRHNPQHRLLSVVETLEQLAVELTLFDKDNATALRTHANALGHIAETFAPGPRLDPLTPAQSRVLICVRQYFAKYGIAPTRQEIADALGFTLNAAQQHLKMLDSKGVLTLTGSGPRAIRLNKRTVAA